MAKSPLKSKPLRDPGQSLREEILKIQDDAMPYVVAMLFAIGIAFLEWWQWYFKNPPSPVLYSIIAGLITLVAIWKIRAAMIKIRPRKLGYEGEKFVAQVLDELRKDEALIFHDIPGKNFNLDHVVVHKSGLYVVETKKLSKPNRGKTELVFNGETVLKNGTEFGRNPITQVRANKRWLSELLKRSTGRDFPIKPVVIYHRGFIKSTREGKNSEVWVLNEKAFIKYFRNEPERMKPEDVALSADRIRIHIENS